MQFIKLVSLKAVKM